LFIRKKKIAYPSYSFTNADPKKQLELAVKAVFNSWDSPRAIKYRNINQITGLKGTAVNIQSMVFGNMGNTSGTGVLFTRNPSTGENKLYGEFLINAQVTCDLLILSPMSLSYPLTCGWYQLLLMLMLQQINTELFLLGRGCSCWNQDTSRFGDHEILHARSL